MTVYTIGYEGLNIDAFITYLQEHRIDVLVDVRQLPLSRKKGFSKTALREALSRNGIGYEHRAQLGCPKPVRDKYKKDGNWADYTVAFKRYLTTQNEAIQELANLANQKHSALMCFEKDANYCHRTMVAEAAAKVSNLNVRDLRNMPAKTEDQIESSNLAYA